MHCTSPRARAGFRILAASRLPGAEPAPIIVCISSTKRMISLCFLSSSMSLRRRSSNCPRYCVPATMAAMSSATMRFPASTRGALPPAMRCARPSTTALLPTPGSPMRIGLFFLRRQSICTIRSVSRSRPTTGSNPPLAAMAVRSVPKWSMTGVSVFSLVRVPAGCWLPAALPADAKSSGGMSSASSLSMPNVLLGSSTPRRSQTFS